MSSFGDKAFVMPQHRSAAASGIESGTASHSGLKAKSRHHGHSGQGDKDADKSERKPWKSFFKPFSGEQESSYESSAQAPTEPPRQRLMSDLEQFELHAPNVDTVQLQDVYIYWSRRATDAEAEVKSCRENISDLQSRFDFQEEIVRRAQEAAIALRASNFSMAEDDDKIRSKLNGIRREWKVFAKDWAVDDLSSIKGDGSGVDEMFARLVEADENQSRDGLLTSQNAGKAPSILLNAELARFIGQEIILQPFISAFGYASKTNAFKLMDSLNQLYELDKLQRVRNGSTAAAHLWRSHTVRFLEEDKLAQVRRDTYYGKLVASFEHSHARFLYHDCEQQQKVDRRIQLQEIFRSTGELFSRLWSQKACISVVGLKDLSKHPFTIGNDEVEAHATHKLEAEDTRMDGKPIQMVVEPAILAWGNERGESYDVRKVWAKAVVWMSLSTVEGTQRA